MLQSSAGEIEEQCFLCDVFGSVKETLWLFLRRLSGATSLSLSSGTTNVSARRQQVLLSAEAVTFIRATYGPPGPVACSVPPEEPEAGLDDDVDGRRGWSENSHGVKSVVSDPLPVGRLIDSELQLSELTVNSILCDVCGPRDANVDDE